MTNTEIEKQTIMDYKGTSEAALLAGIVAVYSALFNLNHYQLYILAIIMFIISYVIHLKNKEYKKYLETKKVSLKDSKEWGDL